MIPSLNNILPFDNKSTNYNNNQSRSLTTIDNSISSESTVKYTSKVISFNPVTASNPAYTVNLSSSYQALQNLSSLAKLSPPDGSGTEGYNSSLINDLAFKARTGQLTADDINLIQRQANQLNNGLATQSIEKQNKLINLKLNKSTNRKELKNDEKKDNSNLTYSQSITNNILSKIKSAINFNTELKNNNNSNPNLNNNESNKNIKTNKNSQKNNISNYKINFAKNSYNEIANI